MYELAWNLRNVAEGMGPTDWHNPRQGHVRSPATACSMLLDLIFPCQRDQSRDRNPSRARQQAVISEPRASGSSQEDSLRSWIPDPVSLNYIGGRAPHNPAQRQPTPKIDFGSFMQDCQNHTVSAPSQLLPQFSFVTCYTVPEFEEVRLLENISSYRLLPA